jgi:UDP-N-acetylglucosamine 2-epimerase
MTSIKRVAVVFDDERRPETTGAYCLRALRRLVTVEHFRPAALERIDANAFDLFLQVDDGLDYRIPHRLSPSAYWAIDTHVDFDLALRKSRERDYIFAAQKDGAERLRQVLGRAEWLPLACDPEIHRPHRIEKRHDICFVGNVIPGPRTDLLRLLQQRYEDIDIRRCYFDEMARAFSAAKIIFNRSVSNDVNMRVFEAMACGSLLITNDLRNNGQDDLFGPGLHLVTYETPEELCDKIDFYLADEVARERIAAQGAAEVATHHTYRHRMQAVLTAIERGNAIAVPGINLETPAALSGCHHSNGHSTTGAQHACSGAHDSSYFEFDRPEIVDLVPAAARRILDIGCGAGVVGAAIRARQPAVVWGIERDAGAAEVARTRLDEVFVGDIEQLEMPPDTAPFDCVVCADIIEHLFRPLATLRKIRTWLAAEGKLIASIPNIRHHSIISGLLEGNWTYESAGLLDRTHVRFFMKSSIERLFQEAGFTITRWGHTSLGELESWERQGRPANVQVGQVRLEGASPEDTSEFFIYQHLVVAVVDSNWSVGSRHLSIEKSECPLLPLATSRLQRTTDNSMLTVLTIFGTRPEAIKLAPVIKELGRHPAGLRTRVCVTAQHRELLDQVLGPFGIVPDIDLDLMTPGQTFAQLFPRMLERLDSVVAAFAPDVVLVQGDTDSAFCGALVAFRRRVAVAHVEAGLRTNDRGQPFPEEANRRLIAQLADWHFAATERSRTNLLCEGVAESQVFVTGNTVIDALKMVSERGASGEFHGDRDAPLILVTAHRRESFGEPLLRICRAVEEIAREFPKHVILFPVHPNPQVRETVWRILGTVPHVRLSGPLDYADFIHVLRRASLVLTDSGGVQEEAAHLGIPVLLLREISDRPESVAEGSARVVGTDHARIVEEAKRVLTDDSVRRRMASPTDAYGDGEAAARIVGILLAEMERVKTTMGPHSSVHREPEHAPFSLAAGARQ